MKSLQALMQDFLAMWYSMDPKWRIGIIIFLIIVVLALVGSALGWLGVEGTPYPSGEGG